MVRVLTTLSLFCCTIALASAASLRKQKVNRQGPDEDDNDDFEYGDKEMAVSQGDQSDFSLHQFLEQDDGRQGSSTSDDDSGDAEIAKEHALAADDHFDSEDTPDTTDSFIQTKQRKQRKTRQDPDEEDGDDFEYGDKEMAVSQGDQADFSLHQFLEQDDGRQGSSTSDDDSGDAEIAKEHALAADDHFDSEDTPDTTDSFIQTKQRKQKKTRQDPDDEDGDDFEYGDKEMAVSQGDQADFSLHQFLEQDDGRQGSSTSDDDTGDAEIAKEHALAADDHFDSEDTPDTTDSFIQTKQRKQKKTHQDPDEEDGDDFEYGDKEMAVSQGDQADFSLHQFLEQDDGRQGSSTSDDDTGDAEIAKEHALAADDHFDSEDTPDTTDSFAQTGKRVRHMVK